MNLTPERRAALVRSGRASLRAGRVVTWLFLWLPLGAFVLVLVVFVVLMLVF